VTRKMIRGGAANEKSRYLSRKRKKARTSNFRGGEYVFAKGKKIKLIRCCAGGKRRKGGAKKKT